MRRLIAAVLAAAMTFASPARAQVSKLTVPNSQAIATGLTYQQILGTLERFTLTLQNNNTNGDNCWIIIGGQGQIVAGTTTTATSVTIGGVAMAAAKHSILLGPGGSYARYYPYVPKDTIYGTCQNSADSIYVDYQ